MADQPTLGEVLVELREARADISEIKDQTKKTNGRVTALEKWQARVLGAVGVLMFLVTVFGAVALDKVT